MLHPHCGEPASEIPDRARSGQPGHPRLTQSLIAHRPGCRPRLRVAQAHYHYAARQPPSSIHADGASNVAHILEAGALLLDCYKPASLNRFRTCHLAPSIPLRETNHHPSSLQSMGTGQQLHHFVPSTQLLGY